MSTNMITQFCESDSYYLMEHVVQFIDSNGDVIAEKVFTDYDMAVQHMRINSRR